MPGGDVFTDLPATVAGGPGAVGGHVTVGVLVGEIVAVGHILAVALCCGAQGCTPGQRPCGGEPLATAHARLGPGCVDLRQQRLCGAAWIAGFPVEHRPCQHHLPLAPGAADTDVGVLVVEQRGAVLVLEHIEGFFGIPCTHHTDGPHHGGLIAGSL
ncbi:hypothetical protein D3C87_1438660 [compost metagenome]